MRRRHVTSRSLPPSRSLAPPFLPLYPPPLRHSSCPVQRGDVRATEIMLIKTRSVCFARRPLSRTRGRLRCYEKDSGHFSPARTRRRARLETGTSARIVSRCALWLSPSLHCCGLINCCLVIRRFRVSMRVLIKARLWLLPLLGVSSIEYGE